MKEKVRLIVIIVEKGMIIVVEYLVLKLVSKGAFGAKINTLFKH